MEVKFDDYKLEIQLEAQSPLIHFQPKEKGATVRASEVKPKLDKYILNKIKSKGIYKSEEDIKKSREYKDIFIDPDKNNALDYKMKIASVETYSFELEDGYKIYYGNRGAKNGKKEGVISDPTITIICFNNELIKLIEKNIIGFFLTTNFGTMQNKGFGSFVPKEWNREKKLSETQEKEVAEYFDELIPGCHCYMMKFNCINNKDDIENRMKYGKNVNCNNNKDEEENRVTYGKSVFKQINDFYSIMKSGRNFNEEYSRSFLFQYMHSKVKIGNEKYWMKKEGISPNISDPKKNISKNKKEQDQKPYYVRALLGTTSAISYLKAPKSGDRQRIYIKSNEFDRVSSPIYFKVIKDTVFIVAFEVQDKIYEKKFLFSNKDKGKTLLTPPKNVFSNGKFDIQDFLDEYVKYYNGLRTKIESIEKNAEVKEVKKDA